MHKERAKTDSKAPIGPGRIVGLALGACLAIAMAAAVPLVNYYVDASDLYVTSADSGGPSDMANAMLEGSNLEGVGNYNERILRRIVINRMDRRSTVVLGSSRAAMISSADLGLQPSEVFNAGVAGGNLQDVIGFYGVLSQQGKLPDRLIISVDPWMLNDNYSSQETRWEYAVGDGYYCFLTERLGIEADRSLCSVDPLCDLDPDNDITSVFSLSGKLLENLFSVTYFQSSLQRLSKGGLGQSWSATAAETSERDLLRSDGSYCYPLSYRDTTAQQRLSYASASIGNIIGLEDYYTRDSENLALFKAFLTAAAEDGVEIELVLFPISNVLWDHMAADPDRYANFFSAEELIRSAAADAGVKVAGHFDPNAYGLDLTSFYDGYHPTVYVVEKVISELYI